jgi:hypothetical protein
MNDETTTTPAVGDPTPTDDPAGTPAPTPDATTVEPTTPTEATATVTTPDAAAQTAAATSAEALRPAEPISEDSGAVIDPAGLSASEAAAAKRAETAAAVALVAAVAASRAEAAAEAAANAQPEVVVAPKGPTKMRRLMGVFAMLLRGVLVLALFVGGYALGRAAFTTSQSGAPTTIIDPTTDGVQPPAVVREFVGALSAGDADALRSSLGAQTHASLTDEFRRFDIQAITGVQTLSTHADGERTATEIVMQGTTTSGVPISINLVVLADKNTIEGFR